VPSSSARRGPVPGRDAQDQGGLALDRWHAGDRRRRAPGLAPADGSRVPAPCRDIIEKVYDIEKVDDSTWIVKFLTQNQVRAAAAGTLEGNVNFCRLPG